MPQTELALIWSILLLVFFGGAWLVQRLRR
jgi:hypothetical protein